MRRRRGIAAVLALSVLVALTLASAMLVDGAIGDLRSGAAAMGEAAAVVAAESRLAATFGVRLDSAALSAPAGTVAYRRTDVSTTDSVAATLQILGPGVARIVVTAWVRHAQVRAIAGRVAFVRLVVVDGAPGEVAPVPIGAMWWVPAH